MSSNESVQWSVLFTKPYEKKSTWEKLLEGRSLSFSNGIIMVIVFLLEHCERKQKVSAECR